MQTANIIEIGQITTIGADGFETQHEIAMIVSFDSPEALHAAVRERACCLSLFGDEGDDPLASKCHDTARQALPAKEMRK